MDTTQKSEELKRTDRRIRIALMGVATILLWRAWVEHRLPPYGG